MSKKALFIYLVVIAALTGCKNQLSNVFHREETSIVVNEVTFDYFSGKIKVDYDGDKNISGMANLRMRKDSLIWISLSPGLGIEVARIMITKDSISVIDKFNKKYTRLSYEKLSKKFNFNIDYNLVESVVLGNLIYPYSRERVKKSEDMFTYDQQQGSFYFKNFIGVHNMKLEKLEVQDTVSKSSIFVNYSQFQQVQDQVLPFEIRARLVKGVAQTSSTKVDLEYNKAEIENRPLNFPFSIPDKYERSEAN